jgi:predicted Zn-dependent protease
MSVLPAKIRRSGSLLCSFALLSGLLMPGAVSALDLGGLLGNTESIVRALTNSEALLGNYSDEQERRLGHGAASVLLGAAPLYGDDEVQRYVNRVGMWLVQHTERANLDWRFAVLDSASTNAFAAPGGYVFVTRGLLAIARDEAEFAGVLAHEIGHVLARHHLQAMTAQERFKFVAEIALNATDTNGVVSDVLLGVTREVYAKGLEQDDEFAADRLGVVIAARAGYDPYGLTQLLRTIAAASADAQITGFFLSTHPPTAQRIERLDLILAQGFSVPARPAASELPAIQARLAKR